MQSSQITRQEQTSFPLETQPRKHGADAVVRCKGFRCGAYLDEDGVWRSPADGERLEVLEVLIRF